MAVIRYLVSDVDAALAFYVDALGFKLVERWGPPFAMVGPEAPLRERFPTARHRRPAGGTAW